MHAAACGAAHPIRGNSNGDAADESVRARVASVRRPGGGEGVQDQTDGSSCPPPLTQRCPQRGRTAPTAPAARTQRPARSRGNSDAVGGPGSAGGMAVRFATALSRLAALVGRAWRAESSCRNGRRAPLTEGGRGPEMCPKASGWLRHAPERREDHVPHERDSSVEDVSPIG